MPDRIGLVEIDLADLSSAVNARRLSARGFRPLQYRRYAKQGDESGWATHRCRRDRVGSSPLAIGKPKPSCKDFKTPSPDRNVVLGQLFEDREHNILLAQRGGVFDLQLFGIGQQVSGCFLF